MLTLRECDLRFALRFIDARPGFACETHLQTGAMQQPILRIGVLQPTILDRATHR